MTCTSLFYVHNWTIKDNIFRIYTRLNLKKILVWSNSHSSINFLPLVLHGVTGKLEPIPAPDMHEAVLPWENAHTCAGKQVYSSWSPWPHNSPCCLINYKWMSNWSITSILLYVQTNKKSLMKLKACEVTWQTFEDEKSNLSKITKMRYEWVLKWTYLFWHQSHVFFDHFCLNV